MSLSIVALEWNQLSIGLAIVLVVGAALLVPYLIKEIRGGKEELGPMRRLGRDKVTLGPVVPIGVGDNNPGRVGDPAPGQPDGQPDPYGARAQRNAPPIKS
jgi:hypothetical protein